MLFFIKEYKLFPKKTEDLNIFLSISDNDDNEAFLKYYYEVLGIDKNSLKNLLVQNNQIFDFSINFVRPSIEFIIRLAARYHLDIKTGYTLFTTIRTNLDSIISSLHNAFHEICESVKTTQYNNTMLIKLFQQIRISNPT